jgi:type IV pilus assembly protein PilP
MVERYSSSAVALLLVLAGCATGDHQDLRQWMAESSKNLRGRVQPIPEIKAFPIVSYDAGDLLEPFSSSKVVPEKRVGSGGNQPDFERPREPLEAYPLESLKMVGVVRQNKVLHALILAGNMVHQVKAGSHLGQNFGVITAVTEAEVRIKELVQDPSGQTADWVERPATLQLVEQAVEPQKEARK